MAKHIGIVGCSAEGAALCYTTLCIEGELYLGKFGHPEVSLHTHSFAEYMKAIEGDDWETVAALMLSSSEKLKAAGADFLICPDNTIHQAFDRVAAESPLPWLHIADEVGREARQRGFSRLGILGTRYTMQGPVYAERLREFEIETVIPDEEERLEINRTIFDELVYGVFRDDSRALFNDIIASLKQRGCDAVVLGCTEIPLLIDPGLSPLPTLDSTRTLARAALRRAMR